MFADHAHFAIMKAEQMLEKTGTDRVLEFLFLRQSIQIVTADWLHLPARGWVRILSLKFEKIREFRSNLQLSALNGVKHLFLQHVQEVHFCAVPRLNRVQQFAFLFFACVEVVDAMHILAQPGHFRCVTSQRNVDSCHSLLSLSHSASFF